MPNLEPIYYETGGSIMDAATRWLLATYQLKVTSTRLVNFIYAKREFGIRNPEWASVVVNSVNNHHRIVMLELLRQEAKV